MNEGSLGACLDVRWMTIRTGTSRRTLCVFSKLGQREVSRKDRHPHDRRHHSACASRPIGVCSREGERGLDLHLEVRIGTGGWPENGMALALGPRWERCRRRSGVESRLRR